MSSTLIIPINYGFIYNQEGDLVLHPSIKCRPSIIEDNGLIKAEPTFQFTLGDGDFYRIEMGKENKDDFFDSYIIFTGFHSTGLNIIKELNVPEDEIKWVN